MTIILSSIAITALTLTGLLLAQNQLPRSKRNLKPQKRAVTEALGYNGYIRTQSGKVVQMAPPPDQFGHIN